MLIGRYKAHVKLRCCAAALPLCFIIGVMLSFCQNCYSICSKQLHHSNPRNKLIRRDSLKATLRKSVEVGIMLKAVPDSFDLGV